MMRCVVTKRRQVILILATCVFLLCVHNINQSYTVILGDIPLWRTESATTNQDALSNSRNEVIHEAQAGAGDKHRSAYQAQQNIPFSSIRLSHKSPQIIDTIPGRRTKVSKSNRYPLQENWGQPENETLMIPDHSGHQCELNITTTKYKYVNGTKLAVPLWQQKLLTCGPLGHLVNGTWKFNLAELLQVRIYDEDKANWTIKELKQWLHYMFLVGVEHVFICDHYKLESERLDVQLKRYIELGLITYFPWGNIRNAMQAKEACYQHIIDNYKQHTRWQMAVDMDEYPFTPLDLQEGALLRYLQNVTRRYGSRISEISMSNYLMLGQGDRSRDMVIERINRMTPKPANGLVKPIYRPWRVHAGIHHNRLLFGNRMNSNASELQMLHYWGARNQDWGPDTEHTFSITRVMNNMRNSWPKLVRQSLLTFDEFDAFSNSTGP